MSHERSSGDERRLYSDLAWLWPIISPPQNYVEETEQLCQVVRDCSRIEVRSLLHLGCGAGHNDYTLKEHFEVTGVDLSEAMLEMGRRLNPQVAYAQGDMRTVRLGRSFDAVMLLDSVGYMLTEDDLRAAFATAFIHLKPGGVFLTIAELTQESFQQNLTFSTTHGAGDIEVAFIENHFDPDPGDTTCEVTLLYLIRRSGRLDIEIDPHVCGLFPLHTWRSLLKEAGFEVSRKGSTYLLPRGGEAQSYHMFVCLKPLAPPN